MLFIKLTSPASTEIYRVYINAERIEEMVWNASMQRTYISMSGGDDELREVRETPEEILQQIDSLQNAAVTTAKPHRIFWAEPES